MKIELELEVVTPLIMSGAYQEKFELREQSINGAMRYWYRKLYGVEGETEIFGSTNKKGNFTLRSYLIPNYIKKELRSICKNNKYSGIKYLAFRSLKREALIPPSKFMLILTATDELSKDEIKKLIGSLWATIYIGGLGSRSRRGFGSLKLTRINTSDVRIRECFSKPGLIEANMWLEECMKYFSFRKWFETVIFRVNDFDVSSFVSNSYKFNPKKCSIRKGIEEKILDNYYDFRDSLNLAGIILMHFRACMEPDYSESKKIYRKFEDNNYKLVSSDINIDIDKEFKRSKFGLPISFKFSNKKKAKPLVLGKRKPSQFFIRISNFGDKKDNYICFYVYKFENRTDKVLSDFMQAVQKSLRNKK